MNISPENNGPVNDAQNLYQRKMETLKLVAGCKHYISHQTLTEDLNERVKALQNQDHSLTTGQAIVILLDFSEREFREIARLEKGETSFMTKIKTFFQVFTNIFE